MSRLGPIGRVDLIRRLRQCGFDGPHHGTKHPIMRKGTLTLRVPNPHHQEIGPDLLSRILRQAQISRDEWQRLK